MFIPPNAVIGEWNMYIETTTTSSDDVMLISRDIQFIVLFNPWCPGTYCRVTNWFR